MGYSKRIYEGDGPGLHAGLAILYATIELTKTSEELVFSSCFWEIKIRQIMSEMIQNYFIDYYFMDWHPIVGHTAVKFLIKYSVLLTSAPFWEHT